MILDYYTSTAYALELLAQSSYHSRFQLGKYMRTEILPALNVNQARIYLNGDGLPTAMVTWAWLSTSIEQAICITGRSLCSGEWQCGDRLFFNDWITPHGNIKDIVRDMTNNVFPNQVASSLRRNSDGSVRKVNRWTGSKVRTFSRECHA